MTRFMQYKDVMTDIIDLFNSPFRFEDVWNDARYVLVIKMDDVIVCMSSSNGIMHPKISAVVDKEFYEKYTKPNISGLHLITV